MLLANTLNSIFSVLSAVGGIAISMWYLVPFTVPLGFIYFFLQRRFRQTSIEIQRMEAASRFVYLIWYTQCSLNISAPPISHMTAAIDGLDSLRAYNHCDEFRNALFRQIDYNNAEKLALKYGLMWISVTLEFVGDCFVALSFLGLTLAR